MRTHIKILVLLTAFFTANFINGYDSVKLKDGKLINGETVLFNGNTFSIGKEEIDRNKVSHALLNLSDKNETSKSELDDITPEELIRRGDQLTNMYPDAKSIVLSDQGIEKLTNDGKRYSRSRYSFKVMNESQLNSGNLYLYNAAGKSETKLIFARNIKPDGSIEYFNPATTTYTTPTRGDEFYGNDLGVKIAVCMIPGVVVGSIIDYEIERVTLSVEDENQYHIKWYFNSDNPVYESKIKIMIPANKEFYIAKCNLSDKYFTSKEYSENGYKIYSFVHSQSAPVVTEPQGPQLSDILSYIEGSTFKDQKYLSAWLSRFFNERMVTNENLRTEIDSLVEGISGEEEKIALLYSYFQENIKYLSIKTSLSSGLAGHKATETFSNKYGDCIDKSILFATSLNYIGIEAYPVIVMTNDNPQPNFDKLGVIDGNHAINEVHLKNNKVIYLDTTGNSYRYPFFRADDKGVMAWNPIKNTIRSTGHSSVEDQMIVTTRDIVLKNDGSGVVTENHEIRGSDEARFREFFKNAQDENKKATMEFFANNSFSGSVLDSYSFDNPLDFNKNYSYKMNYHTKNIVSRISDLSFLKIRQDFGFDFISPIERIYPIIFPTVIKRVYDGRITLPENVDILGVPDEIVIKTDFLTYTGKYTIDGNTIIYKNTYERTGTFIKPENYGKLREALIKIDDYIKTPIILRSF